jgi:CheY-like chemotaxis protein
MKVLMIDDNELDLLISKKLISRQDPSLEFTEFTNAYQALDHLKAEQPYFDVILLDLNMPEIDGWGFLNEYQQLESAQSIVYILTSSLDARDKSRAEGYWAVKDYLDKPLKAHYIEKIIAHQAS